MVRASVPFLCRKSEQAAEIVCSTCLTVTVLLNTATAYGLFGLPLSLSQGSFSPKVGDQNVLKTCMMSLYTAVNRKTPYKVATCTYAHVAKVGGGFDDVICFSLTTDSFQSTKFCQIQFSLIFPAIRCVLVAVYVPFYEIILYF